MADSRPIAVDLCCGLGGWTDGLLAEGWRCIGYDIEEHAYGDERYGGELVIQDVLTLDGRKLRDASLIVASPPCTEYSYMAMPWRRAKQIGRALHGRDEFPDGYTGSRTIDELNALFNACFRIQRQASEAAGRHIPMIVENVRGAIPWVGRSRWNYGSFHLWGDVPALMPATILSASAGRKGPKVGSGWKHPSDPRHTPGLDFTRIAAMEHGRKQPGLSGPRANGKGDAWFQDGAARAGSKSPQRKAMSALIAKIPDPLARHIARTFWPDSPESQHAQTPLKEVI